jgi:hypothetical protein
LSVGVVSLLALISIRRRTVARKQREGALVCRGAVSHPGWLVEAARTACTNVALRLPPSMPADSVVSVLPFGSETRQEHFRQLARSWTADGEPSAYLNHGSYGQILSVCQDSQRFFQARLESQPVNFMENEALVGSIMLLMYHPWFQV